MAFLENVWDFSNCWGCWKFFGLGLCSNDVKSSYIAFHASFNYIFMYFRYVLYMLSCCVLVDLDWAEFMMHLNLHVICSCIFMHMYLHFLIFLYTTMLVLFWFSLSLSLSCVSLLLWHLNTNLLCPRTLCILGIFFLWPYTILCSVPW